MDELNALAGMGLVLPTPAYIFGAILFGLVGFAAYRYGKRTSHPKVKWIGVALMLYPYAISGTAMLYVVGAALCFGMYFWRE